MDKISGKLNSMAGGGKESEKNEDQLDKGEWLPPASQPILVCRSSCSFT